jgi:hypothetical protein
VEFVMRSFLKHLSFAALVSVSPVIHGEVKEEMVDIFIEQNTKGLCKTASKIFSTCLGWSVEHCEEVFGKIGRECYKKTGGPTFDNGSTDEDVKEWSQCLNEEYLDHLNELGIEGDDVCEAAKAKSSD